MKADLGFDPDDYTYGDATKAVRRIIAAWAAIDWFAPSTSERDRAEATRHFEAHHAAAHLHAPRIFPPSAKVTVRIGDWSDFRSLYARVSAEERHRRGRPALAWDWKYAGLKAMTKAHSDALRFEIAAIAREISADQPPRPSDLFFRWEGVFMWNGLRKPNVRALLPEREAHVAEWYLTYASMDAMDAIEWQLAERSDDLGGNPFVPLLEVYAKGLYPFSLAPNDVVLFGFGAS